MTIAIVGTPQFAFEESSVTGTITINESSIGTIGSTDLVCALWYSTDVQYTPPSNMTAKFSWTDGNGGRWGYYERTGSGGTQYVFTEQYTHAHSVAMWALSGADTSTGLLPNTPTTNSYSTGADSTFVAPSVTTTANNSMRFAVFEFINHNSVSSPPSGMTALGISSTTAGVGDCLAIFYALQASSGASGTASAGFGSGDLGAAFQMYVAPGATAPVITAQPQQQTTADGSTATFTITATGADSYQWQTRAPGGGSWSNVGTSSNSYTTGALTRASDSGRQYRCVATNTNGSTTSDAADVRVTAIPSSFDGLGLVVGSSLSFVGDAEVGAIDSNDLTGSLNVTFAALTASGSSALTISGALSSTLGALTLSGSGSSTITGALSKTFADLTTAGSGALLISGSAALTLSDMTASGTATISGGVTGSAAITFADMTLAATGQSTIDGALNSTFGNLTTSGAASLSIVGTLSSAFSAMTVGGTSRLDIAGAAAITLADMASNGSAELPIWGQGAGQMGPMTVSGSAAIGIAGASSVTFAPMTMTGTGALEFHGAAAIALAPMTSAGSGALRIDGALSATFADMTAVGESIITGGITGSAHITFDAMTVAGTAVQLIDGALTTTFADLTVSGSSGVAISGSASLSFGPLTVFATGNATEPITGQADITFADMSLAGVGNDGATLDPKYMGSVRFIPLKKKKKDDPPTPEESSVHQKPEAPRPRVPGLVAKLLQRVETPEIVNKKAPPEPEIVNRVVNPAPVEVPHVSTLDPFYKPDPAIDRDLVLERMAQIETDLGVRIAQLEAEIAQLRAAPKQDAEEPQASKIDPFYTPPPELEPQAVRKTRNADRARELARKLLIDDI